MELRPYQQRAIDSLYEWFQHNSGHPCLVLPTGSGKSHIIAELCRDVIQSWPDQKILVLTHVKELIEQDAEKILMAWPTAPLGIFSAGIGRKELGNPITVASIQSIGRHVAKIGHVDLIIVDEAHLISHKNEGGYRRIVQALEVVNPNVRVVGLTATPYRLGHGLITEGSALFDALIEPTSIEELIFHGHLAPLRSKLTDLQLSTAGVRKRGGEFIESELQAAINKPKQNERIIREIVALAGDRKAWLLFCTGVDHALAMRDLLRDVGVTAECVLGETPKPERERMLEDFKSGRVRAMTNANVLCLDEETEILTSSGFVGIDEMSSDHLIAGWKLDGGIDFAAPEQIVKRDRMKGEQMVIFGGGMAAEIRVTGNHRMVVRSGAKRASIKVVPANTLIGKSFSIPAFGESHPIDMDVPTPIQRKTSFSKQVIANSYNYRKKGYSKEEARKKAEELAFKRLSMEYKKPDKLSLRECQFIGFWLGDGTISAGRMSISQSMTYRDIVEEAEVIFKECGLHYTKSITPKKGNMKNEAVRWSFSRGTGGDKQEVTGGFFHLEPYLKKRGTNLFLGLSKDQLKALLYGLWLADGVHHGVSGRKNSYVAGTQFDLYNVLQAACSMRGISSTLSRLSPPRKENHSQQWRFSWGERNSCCYTGKSSRIDTEWKKERVWCVTSSTSFLICRRKGKVFVTGNTTGFDYPDVDLIAMCRPTMSPGLYVQMAGRGMRVKSHTDHCLVLDFAGVVQTHGPITAVRPPSKKGTGQGVAPVKVCERCHELVHPAIRECPACGFVFPPPQPKKLALRDVDIMGRVEPEEMQVDAWEWKVYTSRAGKEMVTVTYCNGFFARVTEYLCLLHGGYAGAKAVQTLALIARGCGVTCPEPYDLQGVVDAMSACPAPSGIAYTQDGKYNRVIRRWWDGGETQPNGL